MYDFKPQKRDPNPLLISACIVATLWNFPRPVHAAEAIEIQRPFAAEGDLAVTIEEDRDESSSEVVSYVITFKNLSDREVAYEDLKISYPDNEVSPTPLSAAELEQVRQEIDFNDPRANQYSSSGTVFPHYIPSSRSGGGSCNDACAVVIVLLVVFFVVVIAVAIASEVEEKNRLEQERLLKEAAAAERLMSHQDAPIKLLRYREAKRFITLRRDPMNPVKTIKIEVIDKNEKTRTFKAEMRGKAST